MLKTLAWVVGSIVALGACGDDGANRLPPDTVLDDKPPAITNQTHAVFTFHAEGVATSFLCEIDGNQAECIPPFEIDLAEGMHHFSVAAIQKLKPDDTPATYDWVIDTSPPDTAITSGPPAIDNATTATFSFTSPDPNATFECSLDGIAFAPCTSPSPVTPGDGDHNFSVRAKDQAGNVDPSPAQQAWTLDSTAPETTIISGPTDGSTTAASVSFAFTSSDAAATFECAVDNGTFAACTSPFASTLANGGHVFMVRAKDSHGLADPSPAMRAFTVDAIPPPVTIDLAPPDPTNDNTPSFMFSSTDPTATFECQIDGVVTFTACAAMFDGPPVVDGSHTFRVRATDPVGNQSTATYTWLTDTVAPVVTITSGPSGGIATSSTSFGFTATGGATTVECSLDSGAFATCASPVSLTGLAEGPHTFTVRGTDAAGNAGMDARSFFVDTVPPVVTITSGPTNPTNNNAPTFTFTVTGATAIDCKVDSGAFATCASPFTTATLADGSHTVTIRGTDSVGNTGTASATFTVDTVAPIPVVTAGPSGPTNDSTPTFGFTTGAGAVTIQCRIDGNAFVACTSPFTSAALLDGAHTFEVRVTDAAGNVGNATRSFSVDTVPPTVTITSGPNDPTNSTSATLTFTISEGTSQCRLDAGAFAACTSPVTFNGLAQGTHSVVVRATDAAGNVGSATFTWTIDTTAPVVTFTSTPANPSNSSSATFAFTVTEGSPQCKLDAGAFAACTSPVTLTGVADGSHTFTVRSTDTAGNTGSASFTWTIDTVPPIIAFTATPSNPTNSSSATFAFTVSEGSPQCRLDAAAFAACTSPVTLTGLADGSHTFTVRATDAAGNTGSASFTWTVDTVPPVVTFTSTPANPSNSSSASFAFTVTEGSTQCRLDAGAFAACTSPVALASLADGSHTFTVRATDAAGNTGSASFTWTIDTTPPVVAFDDVPPAQWPVNYYDMAFHTTDGTATLTCSLNGAAFSACTSPLTVTTTYGVTSTFAVRATDPVGNSSTVQTTWTSTAGLVLHYPWEQGLTHDTSLLKQRPPYASDGPAAPLPIVGGWAGTAAGSPPAHIYPKTLRALSSSVGGNYTASIWVRANAGSNGGTIWTNATAQNGIRLTLAGTVLTLIAFDGGNSFTVTDDAFPPDQWVNVAVRTTGPGKGVQLWINGTLFGTAATPARFGFDAGQATNVTVGALAGVDVDDLRFYNIAFSTQEMCTVVARGLIPPTGGACLANRPGYELDFEGRIADTGFWGMRVTPPQASQFVALKLGQALQLTTTAGGFSLVGFANNAPSVPEHTFTMWFTAGDVADTLVDFTRSCSPSGGLPTCGAFVKYVPGQLQFFFGTTGVQRTATINVANGPHSIVVAEQKSADGTTTQQVSIFVDGVATKVPMGSGNLYTIVADTILLSHSGSTIVDELEFFPRDLTADPEMLCENGLDGEFDIVTGTCLMTSN